MKKTFSIWVASLLLFLFAVPLAHAQDSDWTISGNDQYSAVSGYVGIGTTAPLTQLDVSSSTSALRLRAGSAATNFVKNQILFSYSGTPFYSHAIKSRHSSFTDDNALDFFIWDYLNDDKTDEGSLHAMTISAENDGSVGVGTTTPSDRLHIYSDDGSDNVGYVLGNADRQWRIAVRGDNDDLFSIQDDTASQMRLVIDDSGNVGIGTSSPTTELDVSGDIKSSGTISSSASINSGSNISAGGEISATGDITSGGTICDSTGCITSSSSKWNSGSSSAIYYTSGSVSVGTSSPSYLFHVSGTTGAGKNLIAMTDTSHSQTLAFGGYSGGVSVYNLATGYLSFGTDDTERVRIDSSGNVGVGTSYPSSELTVDGKATFDQSGDDWAVYATSDTTQDDEGAVYGEATTTSSSNPIGVWGVVSASGTSSGQPVGVRGDAQDSSPAHGQYGLLGYNHATSQSSGDPGVGVWGGSVGTPGAEAEFSGIGHGVQGESYSNYTGSSGVWGINRATTGTTLGVYGQVQSVSGYGVFSAGPSGATGYKSAIVPTSQGATELYVTESAEVWFEDMGFVSVVDGYARVDLDPLWLETVTIDDDNPMHVFVQAYDNTEAQSFVVKRGDDYFEIVESNGGASDVLVSFRVMAKRAGYEDYRLRTVDERLLSPDLGTTF